MDIAVKQRILGGVVLVAGAILFLPMLLEGAGVRALQPPTPPTPPVTPTTAQLAPASQAEAASVEEGISASHGEPTFYPVQPPQVTDNEPTQAVEEQFRLVEPAQPAAVTPPPVAASAAPASDPAAQAAHVAASKALAEKQAAQLKAEQVRLAEAERQAAQARTAAEKKAAEQKLTQQHKLLADKKAAEAKRLADEKARAEKAAAAAKLQAAAKAKADAEKAATAAKAAQVVAKAAAVPDPALPQAWVVQVASLSAKDKAQALVDKLRAKGYRAALGGGEGAWRVSIGPELDKAVAESVKSRVAADPALKLSGWIQAYRP